MRSDKHVLILKTLFNSLMVMVLVLAGNSSSKAQGSNSGMEVRKASLHLIAQPGADSVVLRWAPSTAWGWVIANQLGYTVERI
ncbi:MAG TPA: hypothetical protein VJ951_12015, partial [Bacteroidales bacterium]|nr:hypothetical protein [Bacteroidales bacterium]